MQRFREAVEAQDLDAMMACMADDILFHSPVAFRPFTGREAVAGVLGQILKTLEDFRYTDQLSSEDERTTILVFRAHVGDKSVEGIDLIRVNDDGLVDDFTVMLRPVSGLMAVGERMAPVAATLDKAGSDAGHV
jgi:hypothetical protein